MIFTELKIAGAASLQRDREFSSQSELGLIATPGQYIKPQSSNINMNVGGGNFTKHFSGKASVNASEVVNLNNIPSSR